MSGERLDRIFPELGEIPGPEFSPSENGRLSGIFPEMQRLWRSRLLKSEKPLALPDAPYDWQEVMQWAVMGELASEGLSPRDAWQIAAHPGLRKIYDCDFRNLQGAPLFVFYRRDKRDSWEVETWGTAVTIDPRDPYWGSRSHIHAFNFSEIQQRVVAAYEKLREKR